MEREHTGNDGVSTSPMAYVTDHETEANRLHQRYRAVCSPNPNYLSATLWLLLIANILISPVLVFLYMRGMLVGYLGRLLLAQIAFAVFSCLLYTSLRNRAVYSYRLSLRARATWESDLIRFLGSADSLLVQDEDGGSNLSLLVYILLTKFPLTDSTLEAINNHCSNVLRVIRLRKERIQARMVQRTYEMEELDKLQSLSIRSSPEIAQARGKIEATERELRALDPRWKP